MPENDCLFCKIVKGEIPAKKVYEDSNSFAFLDINPRNPGHTLVIPKRHYETIFDIPSSEAGKLFESVRKIAGMVKNGMNAHGINISQSNGKAAGQIVSHLHVHVIPRFVTEGPVGLEGVLQVKKLDEESTNKIVENIKNASPEKKATENSVPKGEKKESAKEEEELTEDDLEEINLDI